MIKSDFDLSGHRLLVEAAVPQPKIDGCAVLVMRPAEVADGVLDLDRAVVDNCDDQDLHRFGVASRIEHCELGSLVFA